jgi:hypothetical protein
MLTAPWAIVVDGFGELSEWVLGAHVAGKLLDTNEATMEHNVIEGNKRTVVLSRPVKGKHFTFPTVPTEIDWMDAVGFTKQYAMHKHRAAGKLRFAMRPPAPTMAPTTPSPTPAATPQMCVFNLDGVASDEGVELAALEGQSLSNCKEGCLADARCKSFAWSSQSRRCYLKEKRIIKGVPNRVNPTGFKTYFFAQCGEQVCFMSLGSVAVDEGQGVADYSGQSLDDCIQLCSTNDACNSFAFSSKYESCHLKDRVIDPSAATKTVEHFATYSPQKVLGECPTLTGSGEGGRSFRHEVDFSSLRPAYDFIVIGGGAAGCAAAWSLAHMNPSKAVLLIEAGPREPLDFNEGFAQASKNHDLYNHNGWRYSSLLGGGTVRNGRSFRGIPRWYTQEFMDFGSADEELSFEESALWAADYFGAPKRWPGMQRDVLKKTMSKVPEIRVPSDAPDAFMDAAGYSALSFRNVHDLVSASDAPGYAYYTLYAKIEDGRRTSGQRLVEEYHGKNLDILVDTMVDSLLWGDGGRTIGLKTSRGDIPVGGEVIVAANVYETPSLLHRSGLGPKAVLRELNVNPAAIHSPIHEKVGEGYWNNIYVSRYFDAIFSFNLRFGQDFSSGDRLHTFARRKMFGIEARIRGDHDVPGGWLDLECSSDMPRGSVAASGEDMKPNGKWPYEADLDGFITVVADCIQAYFLDSYWPMFKAFKGDDYGWAVDTFLKKKHSGLRSMIKAAGPPSAENSGPRWVDYEELREEMTWRWGDSARGDVDSIHYGGSCHECVDKRTFLLHGSTNVRIADLAVFSQPLPGNTMAAAYTIGNYVAKLLSERRPIQLQSKESFQNLLEYRKTDLTYYRFADDIDNHGYKPLYKMDGSNLLDGWFYDMIQDHEFYHNHIEQGVCGITFANRFNQFLISEGAYYNFALKFCVKIAAGLNSGVQIRSYVEPGRSTGAQLFGPQLEIDDDDVGLFYHEGVRVVSGADAEMVKAWKREEWNAYEAVMYDNRYYWRVNGKEKELTWDFDNKDYLQIHNRIGLQVHWPMDQNDVGGESCWKHILVKELKSSSEADGEISRLRASR